MSNVIDLTSLREMGDELRGGPRPPDNGGMELIERVGRLETDMRDVRERISRIEVRLETVATKVDLVDTKSELIKWIVGTVLALGATGITVMTFVLNQAVPKTAPQAALAPIVISMPAPVASLPASAPNRP